MYKLYSRTVCDASVDAHLHHSNKMKSRSLLIFAAGVILGLLGFALAHYLVPRTDSGTKRTFCSFDPPTGPAGQIYFNTNMLKLDEADLTQVLNLYQEVSGRTVIRNTRLSDVKITLHNATPLNRVEALQLLDTALAENGIAMIVTGELAMKAVPTQFASAESPPEIELPPEELPDSSSFMVRVAPLRKANADQVTKLLGLFSANPSGVIYVPSGNILILRDYSSNIRRMLHLLDEAQQPEFNFNLFSNLNSRPAPAVNPGNSPQRALPRNPLPTPPPLSFPGIAPPYVALPPPERHFTPTPPPIPRGFIPPPWNTTNGGSSETNR